MKLRYTDPLVISTEINEKGTRIQPQIYINYKIATHKSKRKAKGIEVHLAEQIGTKSPRSKPRRLERKAQSQ